MDKKIKTVGSFTHIPRTIPSIEQCDVVEIRLDAEFCESSLNSFIQQCGLPKLITARDINEGAVRDLSLQERISLLEQYAPIAQYLDVELRNWSQYTEFLESIRNSDTAIIASYHDFTKTPSADELASLVEEAKAADPDIIKFAFMIERLEDIQRCQQVLFDNPDLTISIMGMGAYAPVSRIILAQSGSVLNYGFLGEEPTAPGQWSAQQLKAAIQVSAPVSQ